MCTLKYGNERHDDTSMSFFSCCCLAYTSSQPNGHAASSGDLRYAASPADRTRKA